MDIGASSCYIISVFKLLFKVSNKLVHVNSFLSHGVSVTDRYAVVLERIKVKGDAEGSTDLVLSAVSLTDLTCLVVLNVELLCKLHVKVGSGFLELLCKRKDSCLYGSKCGVEVHYCSYVGLFAVADLFLVICFAYDSKEQSLNTERRLDYVRNVLLVGLGVEVFHALAAGLHVLGKVIVGSVRNAPKLAPAEGEEVLEVGSCLGIEAKLLGGMVTESEMLLVYAEAKKEVTAVASPVLEPLKVGAGLAEELKLHLLELSYTEDEVAGSDLVSERLTYLTNAERNLFTCGSLNVVEVYENTLSSLGTEIKLRLGILSYALEGLEHKVELTDIGEILLAALGALDIMLVDVVEHLLICPACNVCAVKILDELVCTVTGLALLAVHERVGEAADVTGSHPCLGVHKDSGVKTYVVGALLNELLLPSSFDIVLQLNAEGTVVPCVGEAAVDFTSGIYKASAFTERYDLVHSFFCCHNNNHLLCPQANFFPQWGILTVTFNYIPYRGCCQEINFRLSLDYQWLKQSIELQIRWNQSSNDDWNESLAELSRS